jgi:hypothetical protein
VSLAVIAPFEVSLDCVACRRRLRTVVFGAAGATGRCTPTGHPFAGRLLRLEVRGEAISGLFSYRYTPFVDVKYPDEYLYEGFERGAPAWVRFSFVVTCGSCGGSYRESTQSNLNRPWTKTCECGAILYEDRTVPTLSWFAVMGHEPADCAG